MRFKMYMSSWLYVIKVGPHTKKDPDFGRAFVRACLAALPAAVDAPLLDNLARQLNNQPEMVTLAEKVRHSDVPVHHTVDAEYLAHLLAMAKPAKWVLRYYHPRSGWIEQYHVDEKAARAALWDQEGLAFLKGWEPPSLTPTSGRS
jgi:hypothetical protein